MQLFLYKITNATFINRKSCVVEEKNLYSLHKFGGHSSTVYLAHNMKTRLASFNYASNKSNRFYEVKVQAMMHKKYVRDSCLTDRRAGIDIFQHLNIQSIHSCRLGIG